MNSHELCPSCRPSGECWFEKRAESVAGSVPPLKPDETFTRDTFDAHQEITVLRIKARDKYCPRVNSVNPDYPGRDNL